MIAILEDIMTATQTNFSLSALAIVGAAFGIAILSTSAHASVTSDLLNCKYNTKQKTISCCQQVIRGKTLPRWFKEANSSCSTVVKCGYGGSEGSSPTGGQGKRSKCFVYIPQDTDRDGGRDKDSGNGSSPPSRQNND
jgi:hypothetical protein